MSRVLAVVRRLDALQRRLDARRRKEAPGQLGLNLEGTGEPCGRSYIARDKTCRVGQAATPKAPEPEPPVQDQLDLSRPEVRLRFTEELRRNSLAGPQASLDGGDVGEILAQLTEAPGRRGENARRLAAFVDQFKPALFIGGWHDPDDFTKPGQGGPLARVRPKLEYLLGGEAERVAEHMRKVHGLTHVQEAIGASQFLRERLDTMPNVSMLKTPTEAYEYKKTRDGYIDSLRTLSTLCLTAKYTDGSTRRGWGQIMLWDEGRPSSPGANDTRTRTYDGGRGLNHDAMLRNARRGLRSAKGAGLMYDSIEGNFGAGTPWQPAKRNEELARTIIHEFGHQIQHRADTQAGWPILAMNVDYPVPPELQQGLTGRPDRSLEMTAPRYLVSRYAALNTKELFAETFVAYVVAPDDLEKFNPALYEWVDRTTKQALANFGSPARAAQ